MFIYNTTISHVLLPKHVLELIKAGMQYMADGSPLGYGRKKTPASRKVHV